MNFDQRYNIHDTFFRGLMLIVAIGGILLLSVMGISQAQLSDEPIVSFDSDLSPLSSTEHTALRLWQFQQARQEAKGEVSPLNSTEHTALRLWQLQQATDVTLSPLSSTEHTALRLWQLEQARQATDHKLSPLTLTEHTALRLWQLQQAR